MVQQPAYTAVPARTMLSRPEPRPEPKVCPLDFTRHAPRVDQTSQKQAASPDQPKKVQWSPAVKAYVARAFEPDNMIEGISQDEMKARLKDIISFFAERQMQDELDWEQHPLPQQLIAEERKVAAVQALSISSTNQYSPAFSPRPKRKSQDMEDIRPSATTSIPPWQKTNLEDRVTFGNGHKEKRQKKNVNATETISKFDQADLERRKQRFNLEKSPKKTTPPWSTARQDSDSDMDTGPVVGTNMSLEKSYFRLTAPPKPETVRPQHILEQTLKMLLKKWKEEKNYNYICNQFKSLRQDLTVQHIKNAFTVKVYEWHARIALEKGDLGEYNQCQTQLKALYLQGLGGSPGEFLAYRILYIVYTCNKSDMNDLLAELTPSDKAHDAVKHALEVRSALALGNYHKFFKLYLAAPNMGAYLMDMFIQRERFNALANISRAYVYPPPYSAA